MACITAEEGYRDYSNDRPLLCRDTLWADGKECDRLAILQTVPGSLAGQIPYRMLRESPT